MNDIRLPSSTKVDDIPWYKKPWGITLCIFGALGLVGIIVAATLLTIHKKHPTDKDKSTSGPVKASIAKWKSTCVNHASVTKCYNGEGEVIHDDLCASQTKPSDSLDCQKDSWKCLQDGNYVECAAFHLTDCVTHLGKTLTSEPQCVDANGKKVSLSQCTGLAKPDFSIKCPKNVGSLLLPLGFLRTATNDAADDTRWKDNIEKHIPITLFGETMTTQNLVKSPVLWEGSTAVKKIHMYLGLLGWATFTSSPTFSLSIQDAYVWFGGLSLVNTDSLAYKKNTLIFPSSETNTTDPWRNPFAAESVEQTRTYNFKGTTKIKTIELLHFQAPGNSVARSYTVCTPHPNLRFGPVKADPTFIGLVDIDGKALSINQLFFQEVSDDNFILGANITKVNFTDASNNLNNFSLRIELDGSFAPLTLEQAT